MSKILLIDGNSIMNRAFYGIMNNKMLMTPDGKYTNAVYGFLSIMFKIQEDLKPEYMMVTFDLKAPTARHLMYEGYKSTRKGMPNELAEQMPLIKEILRMMNISIIEKEGYEADDVIGTLSKRCEKEGLDVVILSGDRDTFQLASDKITIRIPRTKQGKTETEDFNRNKVIETYGVEPKQLIEVKGLMGDTSDNIPGIPGIGEKTALKWIVEYGSIDNIYKAIEDGTTSIKGKQLEKVTENKELAYLSRTLGTINLEVPIENKTEEFIVEEWDYNKVYEKFKELKFNRFIERFNLVQLNLENSSSLKSEEKEKLFNYTIEKVDITNKEKIEEIIKQINEKEYMYYYANVEKTEQEDLIIKKKITSIAIYNTENKIVYFIDLNLNEKVSLFIEKFKKIFENKNIKKYGFKLSDDYVILKQLGVNPIGFDFDLEVAAYDISPENSKYTIEDLAQEYMNLDIPSRLEELGVKQKSNKQITLFDENEESKEDEMKYEKEKTSIYVYCIYELSKKIIEKLEDINSKDLFTKIEMPLVEVLGEMQFNGMKVNKQELIEFGNVLKQRIEILTKEIYELAGEEFNINSTKQLGNILFEKLKLPIIKKNKSGYSTDVDVLEKLKPEHEIIEKILEYRGLMKLNSTYVEGLIPYINPKTNRIHSYFHQTVTATGRISSTEPNLQNIPTRIDLGKQLRKVFVPEEGYIFVDADYSQIELRVLAHISKDEHMIEAFSNDEDIHKQAASKVLNIPIEEVTKEQRSSAKAVNFGIVYGISDFGLAEQLGITRRKAKEYIEQYLEKYSGIKQFMDDIVEKAKKDGYVETLFNRRRNIPELKSNNYMVRQFGARIAMNTPIQGTAADIMKIAMINVYKKLKEEKIDAKIILQVHDELMLEVKQDEKEKAKQLLQECMENAIKLDIPLKVEVGEAINWYEAK